MSQPTEYDDTAFKKALKSYLDIKKNVDPKRELRRRGKNVGLWLIKIYKEKGVNLQEINSKVASLGNRVKIRPKIRQKGRLDPRKWTHRRMIAAELRARRSAKGFTATGWFPSVESLGGNPRDTVKRTGPRRGKLIEKLTGFAISETLVNQQPGAAYTMEKNATPIQAALDGETADMVKYIDRKLSENARKNGL